MLFLLQSVPFGNETGSSDCDGYEPSRQRDHHQATHVPWASSIAKKGIPLLRSQDLFNQWLVTVGEFLEGEAPLRKMFIIHRQ